VIRNYNIVAHDKSQWINEIVNIGYKRSRVPSKKENHILSISIGWWILSKLYSIDTNYLDIKLVEPIQQ
jgi:hypothetical protein